jgi:hypothetical protein
VNCRGPAQVFAIAPAAFDRFHQAGNAALSLRQHPPSLPSHP